MRSAVGLRLALAVAIAVGACTSYSSGSRESDAGADAGDAGQIDAGADSGIEAGCVGGPCDRVIFVTTGTFNGDLGGVQGADLKCMAAATRDGGLADLRTREFIAWIATPTDSPATRVEKPGRFLRPDGMVIARSWNELFGGALLTTIDLDETGTPLSALDDDVWTGVTADGRLAPVGCTGWTSADAGVTGSIGLCKRITPSWTEARTDPCTDLNHLYCIQKYTEK